LEWSKFDALHLHLAVWKKIEQAYMNYQRTTLQNGLRLLTKQMPEMRSASVAFLFRCGSRYEQEALAGVSHFIEHMLFKGSRNYPTARLISDAIEGVGGTFNGSTSKEMTSYTARVPAENLPEVMRVLADMIRYPLFDNNEIEKERSVITEELSATRDDPQEWSNLLIDETMWPDLPLGRDDAGTIESVSHLSREDMLAYMDAHYRPNAFIVSVAGNVNHEEVLALTQELFGNWVAGETALYAASQPPEHTPSVRMVQKDTEQTNVCLATMGVGYTSSDYHSFILLNSLLGEGMSSRLFQSIRENQGLSYDIGSYINSYYETGSLVVGAGVDPEQTENLVRAIVEELQQLCDVVVPEDELRRIKAYVRGSVLLGLEGTQQVASWLGSQECLYGRIRDTDEILTQIDAVTSEDIQRVARACFAPRWRRLAIIGPDTPDKAAYFEHLLTHQ